LDGSARSPSWDGNAPGGRATASSASRDDAPSPTGQEPCEAPPRTNTRTRRYACLTTCALVRKSSRRTICLRRWSAREPFEWPPRPGWQAGRLSAVLTGDRRAQDGRERGPCDFGNRQGGSGLIDPASQRRIVHHDTAQQRRVCSGRPEPATAECQRHVTTADDNGQRPPLQDRLPPWRCSRPGLIGANSRPPTVTPLAPRHKPVKYGFGDIEDPGGD